MSSFVETLDGIQLDDLTGSSELMKEGSSLNRFRKLLSNRLQLPSFNKSDLYNSYRATPLVSPSSHLSTPNKSCFLTSTRLQKPITNNSNGSLIYPFRDSTLHSTPRSGAFFAASAAQNSSPLVMPSICASPSKAPRGGVELITGSSGSQPTLLDSPKFFFASPTQKNLKNSGLLSLSTTHSTRQKNTSNASMNDFQQRIEDIHHNSIDLIQEDTTQLRVILKEINKKQKLDVIHKRKQFTSERGILTKSNSQKQIVTPSPESQHQRLPVEMTESGAFNTYLSSLKQGYSISLGSPSSKSQLHHSHKSAMKPSTVVPSINQIQNVSMNSITSMQQTPFPEKKKKRLNPLLSLFSSVVQQKIIGNHTNKGDESQQQILSSYTSLMNLSKPLSNDQQHQRDQEYKQTNEPTMNIGNHNYSQQQQSFVPKIPMMYSNQTSLAPSLACSPRNKIPMKVSQRLNQRLNYLRKAKGNIGTNSTTITEEQSNILAVKQSKMQDLEREIIAINDYVKELKRLYNSEIQLDNVIKKIPGFNPLVHCIIFEDENSIRQGQRSRSSSPIGKSRQQNTFSSNTQELQHYQQMQQQPRQDPLRKFRQVISLSSVRPALIQYLQSNAMIPKGTIAAMKIASPFGNRSTMSRMMDYVEDEEDVFELVSLANLSEILCKITYFARCLQTMLQSKRADHLKLSLDELKSEIYQISTKTQQQIRSVQSKIPPKQSVKEQILNCFKYFFIPEFLYQKDNLELHQIEANIVHILDRKNYMKKEPFIALFEKKEDSLGEFKSILDSNREQAKCLNQISDVLRDFHKYT